MAGTCAYDPAARFALKDSNNALNAATEQFGVQLVGVAAAGAPTGMAGVFVAGFREFSRLRKQAGIASGQLLEGSRRAMRVE